MDPDTLNHVFFCLLLHFGILLVFEVQAASGPAKDQISIEKVLAIILLPVDGKCYRSLASACNAV